MTPTRKPRKRDFGYAVSQTLITVLVVLGIILIAIVIWSHITVN